MISEAELIAQTANLLPDVNMLKERLEQEPDRVIAQATSQFEIDREGAPTAPAGFEPEAARRTLAPGVRRMYPPGGDKFGAGVETEQRRAVAAGTRALDKISKEGAAAKFEPEEKYGLEAIIHLWGRPAILIQDGRFFPPPAGWELLEPARAAIEETFKSVGRIEVPGHNRLEWIGTGFLVAEDVVMTNRHVAEVFSCRGDGGEWVFEPGVTPCIDYVEELGATTSFNFTIDEVIGIHDDFNVDLALLRVSPTSSEGEAPPEPLTVAAESKGIEEGRKVYVVGYPAWDGRRNDPEPMMRIFSNIFNVKRLQPGEVKEVQARSPSFGHDCSTLGGNSGSCVVDLETNQVIGLHFAGKYLKGNNAVALWKLTDDPLLTGANVNFASAGGKA